MRIFFYLIFLIFLSNCSKPKTVLICGDHVCINKAEANQYFEEYLTIEVKIIDKKIKKEIDLVQVNLNEDDSDKRQVFLTPKKEKNKTLKTLSKEEIVKIKHKIKNKKVEKKITQKITEKTETVNSDEKDKKKQLINNNLKDIQNNANKKTDDIVDICTILKKCSIDEISKYILKQGIKKDFPDITSRQ